MAGDARALVKSLSKTGDVEIMVSAEHLILSCFCGKALIYTWKAERILASVFAYTRLEMKH